MSETAEALLSVPSDKNGRPADLEHRMAALAELLTRSGYPLSRGIMHSMVWWEACLSPSIGCAVLSVNWTRTESGPRSSGIDVVLDGWLARGAIRKAEDEPLLSENLVAEPEILDRGSSICGVTGRTPGTRPREYAPWYRIMDGFVTGMCVGGQINPSFSNSAADIPRMAMADPCYVSDPWEAAGGPGAVTARGASADGQAAGFRGNSAGYAMTFWRAPRQESEPFPPARDFYEAAFLWARLLVNRAAGVFPEFGDRPFLAMRERLRAVETTHADGTVGAVFLDGEDIVASASWRPTKRRNVMTGMSGKEYRTEGDEGVLLCLEVAEARRRQGIGTYVMRHILSRGCRHAPPPPPGGEVLWGRHGYPDGDGSWTLCRVHWPTCRTVTAAAAPDPAM